MSIEYGVTYPTNVQLSEVAWSNFAYAGTRMDDNSSILPTEAPKVGIARSQVDLTLICFLLKLMIVIIHLK